MTSDPLGELIRQLDELTSEDADSPTTAGANDGDHASGGPSSDPGSGSDILNPNDELTLAARKTAERVMGALSSAITDESSRLTAPPESPETEPGDGPASADSDAGQSGSTIPKAQRDRWHKLFHTSALLNSTRFDFDLILETVVDVSVQMTHARRGILFLADEQGNLSRSLGRDSQANPLDGTALDVPGSIVDEVIEERKPIFVPRFTDTPLKRSESVVNLGLHSCMCVPLMVTSSEGLGRHSGKQERRRHIAPAPHELLGVLYVDSNSLDCVFSEEDLLFFLALANHATTAVLNAKLYHQAITDPLTQLFSRRQFLRATADVTGNQDRDGPPASLLMVDVDYFKGVNDSHGHLTGDELLREFATLLRATFRSQDEAFRYGGEEFALLLSDTDASGALILAEKLRRRLEAHRFTEKDIRITASIGIATVPTHARNAEDLVKHADQALYQAKESGRNRCRVWSEELGAGARRQDMLAGIFTGVFATDYDNVRLLIDTFSAINSTMDIGDLLVLAVDKVLEATDAERGALMLTELGRGLVTVVARSRNRTPLPPTERFSRSIPEKVLNTGASVCLIEGGDQKENGAPVLPSAARSASIAEMELRTVMCVPLPTPDRRLGVLYVDSRTVGERLRESSLPFFEALARQLAMAIENSRLRARLLLDDSDDQ